MDRENGRPSTLQLNEVLITTDFYRDELFKLFFAVCYGYRFQGAPVIFDQPHFLFMWPDRHHIRAYLIDESMLQTLWWFRNQFLKMFKVWGLMATPAVIFSLLIVFNLRLSNMMMMVVLFGLMTVFSLYLPVRMGTTAKKKVNRALNNYISVNLPEKLSREEYIKTIYSVRNTDNLETYSETMDALVAHVLNPHQGKCSSNSLNNLKELFTGKGIDRFKAYYSSVVLSEKGTGQETSRL